MNQIINPGNGFSFKRAGVQRIVKRHPAIDMTPMVDLGFLLISFFVITTELTRPTVMDLYTPKDGPPMHLAQSDALTILLDKNNAVYYYGGEWTEAVKSGSIQQTSYSGSDGLRKIIMEKHQELDLLRKQEGRHGLMLLIKPASGSTYKNLVDVLDEVAISMVKKYAVVKISAAELSWLEERK